MAFARKLGKRKRRIDPRTLLFAKYLRDTNLPLVKSAVNWATAVKQWPMMDNDSVGDCTIAAAGHMIECWTANTAATPTIPTDQSIIQAYSAVSGYVPGNDATDNGANELDVLNYWRTTGIAGDKILAYAAVDVANIDHIMLATELFGGLYIGVNLPSSAEVQMDAGKIWDADNGPDGVAGSWGGHAIPIVAYVVGVKLTCVTWGALQDMTWAFWAKYVDEAYGILSADWIGAKAVDPEGFDMACLQADLQAVAA